MELERRIKRDAEIVRLYEDGIGCERIAKTVRLNAVRVRRILKEKGYDLGGVARSHPVAATMWERERVDLRAAITKRASEAARTRLKEIAAEQEAVLLSPTINRMHSKEDSIFTNHLAPQKTLGADRMQPDASPQDIH